MQRKNTKENCRSGVTLTSNKECAFVLRQVSPDLHKEQRGGFTLIELLVVVLIIGILAAAALPKYQLAAEKSRAVQAAVMVKTIADAQESYFLANNAYAETLDELDIDVPGTSFMYNGTHRKKKGLFDFTAKCTGNWVGCIAASDRWKDSQNIGKSGAEQYYLIRFAQDPRVYCYGSMCKNLNNSGKTTKNGYSLYVLQ